MQTERRIEHGLTEGVPAPKQQKKDTGDPYQSAKTSVHGTSLAGFRPSRKPRSTRRGMLLVEAALSLSILTILAITLLNLSLNILQPRQWVLQQVVTDAYMTYERAYAERYPFSSLIATGSPWPAYPAISSTSVQVGRLPGGHYINGTITRTCFPDPGNYPINGGTGTVTTNPAAMNIWKVQSVLTYTIGGQTYGKSRTVMRSQ